MKKTITQTFSALISLTIISVVFFGCGPKEEPLPPTPPAPTTVSVSGVSLNKTSLSLVEGGSESLTATISPDNATNKAVSWKSSDTGVATVDGSGKVTAVKAGSTTITVTTTDGGKTATCSVTVTSKTVSVTGVKLDNGKLELKAGETAQLTATVEPSDASDKSLEWTSSDAKVATVDASGKVTAVGVGSATITVKTKDGGKTATCSVTVAPVAVEGVTVDPVKAEVVEGNTVQLKATVSPADAAQEVEWTSSDSDIATVDKNGLVTSIKPGTVYIVVRSKAYTDKQASCEVIVKQDDKLKGIAFDASEIQLETGQSRTLKVVFTPDYAANKNVSWSSSDPSVASVKDGNVTGVKEGKATITATSEDGGHKAECVVTVSKASGPRVFATTKNWRLLINGAQDPRDGTFTVGNSYKFAGMYQIYPEGHDLYSLEDFFTGSG
ncbi:MAG: Ig domain-containing protein, partial [Bacteroidales bacterium]|nr:Ig domain-containing protein [Bacteroidales bacterium]